MPVADSQISLHSPTDGGEKEETSLSLSDQDHCWAQPLPGLKKLVLLYLARVVVPETHEAHVRMQSVAMWCGLSESTVRKTYRELASDGYLMPLSEPRGALHYRLTIGN